MVTFVEWTGWINHLKNVVNELDNYLSDVDFGNLSYEQMIDITDLLSSLLSTLDEIKVEQLKSVTEDLKAIYNELISEVNAYRINSIDVERENGTTISEKFLREIMQKELLNALKAVNEFVDISLQKINEVYAENPDVLYSETEGLKDKVLIYYDFHNLYKRVNELLDNLYDLLTKLTYLNVVGIVERSGLKNNLQSYTFDIDDELKKLEDIIKILGIDDLRSSFEQITKLFDNLMVLNKIIILADADLRNNYDADYVLDKYNESFENVLSNSFDFVINLKDFLKTVKRRLKLK